MMGSQQTGFEEASTQPPILNPSDFKAYNRLADHMDIFVRTYLHRFPQSTQNNTDNPPQHNNFRRMWNEIYSVCSDNKSSSHPSIYAFLKIAEYFCTQLTLHHTIEERHFSPELAARMPEFREELIGQHREIHHGLDNMYRYVKMCRTG
ncbi:hypothetical protein BOTNAR_0116g00100 [Botryotinia narcissicola]|uniref:Hemerythrin-like domain-containing protein n=1 Tax=Botryotinia narcissicola TaxID=278944 RepID=A0A4Z1IZG0_9HELO|nr:hypothetical protein BOTNAR_0116g00100 [Botryotinia narcissicola]